MTVAAVTSNTVKNRAGICRQPRHYKSSGFFWERCPRSDLTTLLLENTIFGSDTFVRLEYFTPPKHTLTNGLILL